MKSNSAIIFLIIYFVILSGFYAFVTPPLEAPDEAGHLAYVNFIRSHGTIPNQFDASLKEPLQGHQPPLYYMFLYSVNYIFNSDKAIDVSLSPNPSHKWNGGTEIHAPVYDHSNSFNKVDSIFYVFRLLSVLMGALNIFFVYKIAYLVMKSEKAAFTSALFAAMLPQFQFISGVINNDNLANLLATVSLYLTLLVFMYPQRIKYYAMLGIAGGLGAMTKKTFGFVVPAIVLALILLVYSSHTEKRKRVIIGVFISLIVSLFISHFYFIHNLHSYNELVGLNEEYATFSGFQSHPIFSSYFLSPFLWEFFKSFAAYPGTVNVLMPKYIYIFYLVVALSVSVFFIISIKDVLRKHKSVLLLLFAFATAVICIIYFNTLLTQAQGRFLFPVISAIALIFAAGIDKITSYSTPNNRIILLTSIVLPVCFVAADIIVLFLTYRFYSHTA